MGYGTGAIMAVPCGDQRDFEFARKFGLPIPAIQQPPDEWFAARGIEPTLDTSTWPEAFVGDAPYVNSANDGARPERHRRRSRPKASPPSTRGWRPTGVGEATITYKLRDWLFSRQRYWGEPFPIVYDVDGHPHALPDDDAAAGAARDRQLLAAHVRPRRRVLRPGEPARPADWWVEVTLDLGDGPQALPPRHQRDAAVGRLVLVRAALPATRPTRTRSSTPTVERYWMGPQTDVRPDHPGGVDLYVGGVEHAVLHLLYARFWHKVLFDLGHVSSNEPYARLFNQGYVLAAAYTDDRGDLRRRHGRQPSATARSRYEGEPVTREWGKMGKSLKNAVSPDEIYEAYGADTLRLYLMATGPAGRVAAVGDPRRRRHVPVPAAAVAQRRSTRRPASRRVVDAPADDDTTRLLHRTIDGVRTEMEALRFNTAIAKLIELNNHLTKVGGAVAREVAEPLVLMLAPFAPHVAEELWRRLGHEGTITYVPFPVADPALLVDDTVEYPVQVNGKVRGHITVAADADHDDRRGGGAGRPARSSPRSAARRRRRSSSSPAGWSTSSSDPSVSCRPSACCTDAPQANTDQEAPAARLGPWC